MKKVLIKNIQSLLQCGEDLPTVVKGSDMKSIPSIDQAFVASEDGVIVSYGPMSELEGISDWSNLEVIDASEKIVMPAFCDSHTHLVFASSREGEFVDRINGLTYEEIALRGGGILNSANMLANMSEEQLFIDAKMRLEQAMQLGTGALEIKSGYGLCVEAELKMLRVIKRLKNSAPIEIKSTFLGAHAYPPAFKSDHRAYLDLIIKEMLPQIASEGLADYIDVFCERNYFSVDEMAEVIEAGKKYGLRAKVHVNQFSAMGGVRKAVELGALSVDHLEELTEDDLMALHEGDTMPVGLPGCSHFLGIPFTDARRIIDSGLPLALASDFNPGSAPSLNLGMVWSLACIKMKMTPEEALNALTINAAYAMGLSETHGTISVGKKTPLLITKKVPGIAYIPYSFGDQFVEQIRC